MNMNSHTITVKCWGRGNCVTHAFTVGIINIALKIISQFIAISKEVVIAWHGKVCQFFEKIEINNEVVK